MQDEAQPVKLADINKAPALVNQDQKIDMFSSRGFDLAQRIARAFSTSDAVPACFQAQIAKKVKGVVVEWLDNPSALGNCLIAIETAQAVGMSITAVMQNANIIEGKLSWSGKFVIAAVNASRRFTPLRFDVLEQGTIKASYKEKDGWNDAKKKFDMITHTIELENIVCRAWALPHGMAFPPNVNTLAQAIAAGLPVIQGPPVSMKMAVEEGWYAKPGSKWQTEMKYLMLMYRSGAYFGNIHAPDVVMGMGRTTEEHEDTTIEVSRQADGVYAATNLDELRSTQPQQERHKDAETVVVKDMQPEVVEPEAEATPAADKPKNEIVSQEVHAAYESVAAQIQKALSLDALAEAADLIQTVGSAALRAELGSMYKANLESLSDPKPAQAEEKAAPAKRRLRSGAVLAPE